ncbi:MAG: hypothetical protein ABI652_02240 [Acidobacteriota bacterium]
MRNQDGELVTPPLSARPIGDGTPGPITRQLMTYFRHRVDAAALARHAAV